METSLKNRLLGVSVALALSATSCTTYVVESRPVPPVEVYVPAPTVYYYEPSTVYFVANYFDWPASRVEFYFARGWTCHDLLIGFEFSARTRRPWREVVHHYERHTAVYRETHHIQEVHRTTTVEERHFVWSHVAQEIGVTSESAELQASIASPAAYAELEEDLAARAVAQEYGVRATDAERLLEKGYDVGELAAAYDRVEQDRDTAAVEAATGKRGRCGFIKGFGTWAQTTVF
jgi:hypothetical protein